MPVITPHLLHITDVQVRITLSYNQYFLHIDIPKSKAHCAIYYTLDGSTPHRASSRYTRPVALRSDHPRVMVQLVGAGGGLYQYDANTGRTIMVASSDDTALPEPPPTQTPPPAASPTPAAQPAATPTTTQERAERKPRKSIIIIAYLFLFVSAGAWLWLQLSTIDTLHGKGPQDFGVLRYLVYGAIFSIFYFIKKRA